MPKNPNLDKLRTILRPNPEQREYGSHTTRETLLAYGLVRGLPMERLESKNSDPRQFPSINTLVIHAMNHYRPQVEGESLDEYTAARNAFEVKLEADLKDWLKTLHLNWMALEVTRRQRNAAKRATPRVHRPRPATLTARVA